MQLRVIIEDPTQRDVADQLEAADQALRQSFSGFDVDAVRSEVERSLAEIDVDLPADQVQAYAQAIADREDFAISLGLIG